MCEGVYTISDIIYSIQEEAYQIRLDYKKTKPVIAKGDIEFTFN